ncbi:MULTISPECIES: Bcr/CflA family efflux MFS transporter [Pseudomonas]|uniref:Bcr/CflA family efflux transporter n=2 Tax=Pseudomonadaceae TaxID=135621 RepID=A0A0D0JSP8_9PSED|nr:MULTISPECIES: Bcr/CflA family efflux MFS transporter [Pseudomonas]KIP88020.1 hypothetical protein RU08_25205 [Pseudomonas fulva]MCW2293044.1 DHA1 family bicyclomycin/chloramphenicol resistance-like MFS transporter [Pseudomonas sp. BIGb0408]NYH72386.1 DHA1 family bicyclomycin/chloramphenicol resistance-like MFS transporter [Pseudomonas flavescens]
MNERKQRGFIFFAILLAMVNLLASDIYVSAFPVLERDFATDSTWVGWSLSLFFIGSVLTLPIYGAMSDRFGRKPVLLVGLVVFAVGSFTCLMAASVEWFLTGRFIQAAGVCAAYVLWQPMVVDIYPPAQVQRVFAIVMPFLGISPALGPLLGGLLTEQWGWRSIFIFLLAINALLIAWTVLGFRESLVAMPDSQRRESLLQGYAVVLGQWRMTGIFLALGLCIGMYMAYLTLCPFLFAGLGYSPVQIGLTFIPIAGAFGGGGALAKVLCRKYSELHVTRLGVLGAMLGSLVLTISLWVTSLSSALQVIVPFMLVTMSIGVAIPTGTSVVMRAADHRAGTCSSAMNVISSLLAFAVTLVSALLLSRLGPLTLAGVVVGSATLALLCVTSVGRGTTPLCTAQG